MDRRHVAKTLADVFEIHFIEFFHQSLIDLFEQTRWCIEACKGSCRKGRDYITAIFLIGAAALIIRRVKIRQRRNRMDEKITIYQKPTCSKCRTTLEILK